MSHIRNFSASRIAFTKGLKEKLWSSRKRRLLTGAALAFAFYSLAGFLVLPAILQWQLPKQLAAATRRETTIQQVRVNPWTLSLRVRGLNQRTRRSFVRGLG